MFRGMMDASPNTTPQQEEATNSENKKQYKNIEYNSTKKSSNKTTKQKEKLEDMKNITKRDDGRYMIRKVIDGQRITLYANTQAEAREKLQNIKKRKVKTKQQKPTLQEYTDFWYKTYKEPFISKQTKIEVKSSLKKINENIGSIRLNKLTTQNIQNYLNTLQKSRTKERICTYLNAVLQKATDTNVIPKNIFSGITKEKKLVCKRNSLTYAEQVKLLEEMKKSNIEHELMTYLMCGCRPKELPQKQCFDFENNFIHIYGTKNEKAKHRLVKMSEPFAKYMKDYVKTNEIKPHSIVFKEYKEICKKLNITPITLYTLRHTFATNHFTLKTNPKRVQTWLGHSSIQMTLDTYTDIDETSSREKIIKLYNNFYYIQ